MSRDANKSKTGRRKKTYVESLPPARTPEGRESQLTALAMDLLEERLLNKTATAQEIALLVKEGLTSTRLDKELKAKQKYLYEAKTDNLKQTKINQELMTKALASLKEYRGEDPEVDGDDR